MVSLEVGDGSAAAAEKATGDEANRWKNMGVITKVAAGIVFFSFLCFSLLTDFWTSMLFPNQTHEIAAPELPKLKRKIMSVTDAAVGSGVVGAVGMETASTNTTGAS